jgi:ferric enterobactin receptor
MKYLASILTFHSFIFRNITILVIFFLPTFQGKAQQKENKGSGKITGKIIDSLSSQPIEYATVSLIQAETNKVINGATADDKGVFEITHIEKGNYRLLIYFVGYTTGMKSNIIINDEATNINLSNIKLSSQLTKLKEVEITTEKSLIENKIDKMVYNAEKDLTSQGGVATDILKNVPQVSIDVNGNVELQGNTNIRFLINGKPSSIFGNNLADVLQSIPASQIQSIEVITSPGARYDAEGTGGIINIILKKVTAQGINGNLSLSGGTRLENGSFNLSAKKGKFGANAFFSGNAQLLSTTLNNMDRVSHSGSPVQTASLVQDGKSDFSRTGYQTGMSFDWAISPMDNITGAFSFNYFGNTNSGFTNRQSLITDNSGNVLSSVNNQIIAKNNFNSQTEDWNMNYKRKFKRQDQELDILYSESYGNNYSYYQQSQKFVSPDSIFNGSNGKNPGTDQQTNISLNYTQPAGDKVMIETGAKTVLNQLDSKSNVYLLNTNSGNYDFNTSQSSSINYKRNVYAAYLSGTFKLKIIDIKAGCRYEQTETKASFSNSGNVPINPYNTFVPSIVISRSFKNNHVLKLSYTRRIQRPDYRDLNPFINASDPKNITTGNPNLKPEFSDNFELGYNKYFKKGANINISVFNRYNTYDIQQYTMYYPSFKIGDSTYTNVTITTRENIGSENNSGINIFGSVPVTSKINLRTNISGFYRSIINTIDPGLNISGFNYRANLNATFQISRTLLIELFGNFNSPRINAQGKMPSFTTYNFAFRKQLFNKKASIAITATNPFNKYVDQKTELTGTNFTSVSLRQLPYRSFGFNFTYKFGKLEFKKQREAEDANLTNPTPGN